MKRGILILTALTTAAIHLVPAVGGAAMRISPPPIPYQPAPAASYPSTPQIDASMPLIELAPARQTPIRQTPEEKPIDAVEDSETPADPQQMGGSEVVEEAEGKASESDAQAVGAEGTESDVGEDVQTIAREERPQDSVEQLGNAEPKPVSPVGDSSGTQGESAKSEAVPFEIFGGGCALVR